MGKRFAVFCNGIFPLFVGGYVSLGERGGGV